MLLFQERFRETLKHQILRNLPKFGKSTQNTGKKYPFYMNSKPYSRYAHTVHVCDKGLFFHDFMDKDDIPSCH